MPQTQGWRVWPLDALPSPVWTSLTASRSRTQGWRVWLLGVYYPRSEPLLLQTDHGHGAGESGRWMPCHHRSEPLFEQTDHGHGAGESGCWMSCHHQSEPQSLLTDHGHRAGESSCWMSYYRRSEPHSLRLGHGHRAGESGCWMHYHHQYEPLTLLEHHGHRAGKSSRCHFEHCSASSPIIRVMATRDILKSLLLSMYLCTLFEGYLGQASPCTDKFVTCSGACELPNVYLISDFEVCEVNCPLE